MKRLLIKMAAVYCAWLAALVILKLVFLAAHASFIGASVADCYDIVSHGLKMDRTVAAYFTVVPFVLGIATVWTRSRWVNTIAGWYFGAVAVIVGLITVVDTGLYRAWEFRLDMTPIFYIQTSPAAAAASVEVWQWVAGALGLAVIATGLWWLMYRCVWLKLPSPCCQSTRSRIGASAMGIVVTGLLIIPIRGGLTVSTMNPGHVFYSSNAQFNQAALNPVFNLLYSMTHQARFDKQFRFMEQSEAELAVAEGVPCDSMVTDTLSISVSVDHPDVWLIIMESFSSHLMPSLGGEAVAVKLDSLARTGVSFTRTYASSFRTDRALPAVLSGFPGQPSTSVMKFVDKASRLPSIAKAMKLAGYGTEYYYGGDINFTNMNAYLVNGGYERIVSDRDFDLSERMSKWGAHDHVLLGRALSDARQGASRPRLRVVQTSSSHEPFEVPYSNPRFISERRLNAFAYADSCLGAFVDSLSRLPSWGRTLVVITADHQGAWPDGVSGAERHHIPFVITGGALRGAPVACAKIASQTDIAATMLSLVGAPADGFGHSTSLTGTGGRGYAFFSQAHLAGIVTPQGTYTIDTDTGQPTDPATPAWAVRLVKAYLQQLYSELDAL